MTGTERLDAQDESSEVFFFFPPCIPRWLCGIEYSDPANYVNCVLGRCHADECSRWCGMAWHLHLRKR
jgi:hypothetical protein